MKKVLIASLVALGAAASLGTIEAQNVRAQTQTVSEQDKKAWIAHAVDDILSGPVRSDNRDTAHEGRSEASGQTR